MLEVILVKEIIAPILIIIFSVLFYYGLRGTVKKLLNTLMMHKVTPTTVDDIISDIKSM